MSFHKKKKKPFLITTLDKWQALFSLIPEQIMLKCLVCLRHKNKEQTSVSRESEKPENSILGQDLTFCWSYVTLFTSDGKMAQISVEVFVTCTYSKQMLLWG